MSEANELEQIRARHEADPYDRSQAVADRATLLRLLDAAREELDKEQVSHLKTRVMLTRSREAAEPFVAALFNDGETWEPDRIKLRHVQALAAALKEKP